MPAKARVVGDSGGQSNQIVTFSSAAAPPAPEPTSARRKNGVWHSTTRSMPSGDIPGGSGGTASAYSSSISSTTSRGAVANSRTISASFGGIPAAYPRRSRALLADRRRARTERQLRGHEHGEITEGDDADEPAIGVADQHPADGPVPHVPHRVDGARVLFEHHEVLGGDHAERGGGGVPAVRDRADDVPVGHHPREGGALGDDDVADVGVAHGPRRFLKGGFRRQID